MSAQNFASRMMVRAAAFDVLDALRALVAAWDAVEADTSYSEVPDALNDEDLWNAARAAIARAEGRS